MVGKCPKCNAEIDRLTHFQSGENRWNFTINTGNVPYYDDFEFNEDNKVSKWECPECQEVVAYTEEEAIEILKEKEEE